MVMDRGIIIQTKSMMTDGAINKRVIERFMVFVSYYKRKNVPKKIGGNLDRNRAGPYSLVSLSISQSKYQAV